VVADGPRASRPGEGARCAATRSIIDRVDWACEVATNYAETNLGCQRRVVSGLEWVFQQSEEAIVLEDDCLPAPSFFGFCQTLLERYRHDERILLISGDNFLGDRGRNTDSYYFSRYTYTWGWASWRRAFRLYDVKISSWPEYKQSKRLRQICSQRDERKYWEALFDRCYAGAASIWDYQMLYAGWFHDRFSIVPEKNLVSNIGFGDGATHLALGDDATDNLPVSDIWDVVHPDRVEADRWADRYVFEHIFQGRMRRVMRHLRRGYDKGGIPGLGLSAFDLAQRSVRLLRTP
jgi:hypothetical protein